MSNITRIAKMAEESTLSTRPIETQGMQPEGTGLAYGSCYGLEINQLQAAAIKNTWYVISDTDMTDGPGGFSLVTHDGSGKLTVARAGRYLINYSITLEANNNNTHILTGIGISGSVQSAGQSHMESLTNQEIVLSSTAILALNAGQYVELFFRTTDTGTPNINIDNVNLTVAMVGG